jgi:hypothetical protein
MDTNDSENDEEIQDGQIERIKIDDSEIGPLLTQDDWHQSAEEIFAKLDVVGSCSFGSLKQRFVYFKN